MRRLAFALVAAVVIACAALILTGSNTAQPAYACSCLVYIQNLLGIPAGAPCADQAGPYLAAGGYAQVPTQGSTLVPGLVVVFQHGFPGVNGDCGHIALIQDVHADGDTWHVYMRGASQSSCDPQYGDPQYHQWTEAGCDNVCLAWKAAYPKDDTRVTYWRRKLAGDLNVDGTVNVLDFSFLLTHWGQTYGRADINRNLHVDIIDFSILLSNWGMSSGVASPPPPLPMVGQLEQCLLTSFAGPSIQVGTPSMVGGQVQVPVYAQGTGFEPYMAFNIHLRWDPTLFSFVDASPTGGLFEADSTCPNYILDPDGGGATFACAFSDAQGTASTGLLTTITLSPEATGCSRLQLATFGPPDGGDDLTGTFTVNPSPDILAQTNEYWGGSVDADGQVCTPAPCVSHDSDSLCDDVDPDDDNDGLPDEYENAHSCLNQVVNDATADPDSDGLGNLEEYSLGAEPCVSDTDNDGLLDGPDSCTLVPNPDNLDADHDGQGDACDLCTNDPSNDDENDSICVGSGYLAPKTGDNDNCPDFYNPDQADSDGDGIGDVCESSPAVGGIADLPHVPGSSGPNYIALAGVAAAAAALVALGAGAWYARRRFSPG